MCLRHGWRSLLVLLCLALVTSRGSAATASISRDGSRAHIQIDHLHTGDQWRLKGQRGQVCYRQTVMADGAVDVVLPKVASNESLSLWLERPGEAEAKLSEAAAIKRISPLRKVSQNAVLYQIPVRTYAAQHEGQAVLVGQFSRINNEVLAHLRNLGVDYIWLTGAIEQASRQTTDADVVKGDAGSYYALRDMWDAAPELGGLGGLEDLISRAHHAGLRILVDLVPNHTSRLHETDIVCKQDLNFGEGDDTSKGFDPQNNYYYMQGTTFVPPRQRDVPGADGIFDRDVTRPGVQSESPSKVTGNDVMSPTPGGGDWFETVKLNYGVNIFNGERFVHEPVKTWYQILDVARYWVEKGVDGFRVDFAHVVPLEFWRWFSSEIRNVNPETFLVAEAYEGAKAASQFSYERLLAAGIDSIFQSEMYWRLHNQARDKGDIRSANPQRLPPLRADSLNGGRQFTYYLENHDEIRGASPRFAAHISDRLQRAELGMAMTAYVSLLPGNVLLHGGQEFGEDASVFGLFDGNSGKTSIFDFVYQAFTSAWWRGDRNAALKSQVAKYEAIMALKKQAPFSLAHQTGSFSYFDLEPVNGAKPESRWIASYLRIDPDTKETYLVVLNSHPTDEVEATLHFTSRRGEDSAGLLNAMGVSNSQTSRYRFVEKLQRPGWAPRDPAVPGEGLPGVVLFYSDSVPSGLYLGKLAARSTYVFKLERL